MHGTIAQYSGWNGGEIGEPVQAMADRVRGWLLEGRDVRIFTARVAVTGLRNQVGDVDDAAFAEQQRSAIQAWCLYHLGTILPVTATKDFGMVELWDDRCVQVEANTGRRMDGQP